VPRTGTTRAPCCTICTSLARGAAAGTKITASSPAAAHTAAVALAALPVEATTTVRSPRRRASAATRNEARSLSEPLGFSPSFLIQTSPQPSRAASRGAGTSGVFPTA